MSLRRWCISLLLAATTAVAFAQLDVDTAQGPLTLPEEIADAFALWQAALPDDDLAEPDARIAFAPDLLGPETASLTLRWSDARTEVLLAPARYRRTPVLLHELGLLLGLPPAAEGVMDPVLRETSPATPTERDIALLRDVRTFPPADIDRSGRVDFYDLAALGAAFGSVGVNLAADLNGDGQVDADDLAILREAYVFAEPAQGTDTASPPDGGDQPAPDGDAEAEDIDARDGEDGSTNEP